MSEEPTELELKLDAKIAAENPAQPWRQVNRCTHPETSIRFMTEIGMMRLYECQDCGLVMGNGHS
jgi:hypothetical protein